MNELLMDIHSANNIQSLPNDGETGVCTHQLHTNYSNDSKLNQNGIIYCASNKNITIMCTIIKYDKFVINVRQMAQFYQMDDPMHDLNLVMATMGAIDTITHQIEILINATCQYAFKLRVELDIAFGFELRVIRLIDPPTAEYELLIIIRGWAIMRMEVCNGIENNCNPIGRMTIRIDVDDAFNGMFSVINIWIKVSISRLFLDALMSIVDKINSDVEKIPEIEYCYGDNGNVIILVNNLCTINDGATFVGFFLAVIFFIVQVIGGSSLILTVSIKSNVITVAIVQLNINLAEVIHNVCAVFYFIFSFFVFLLFVNVILFDTILILKNMHDNI